MSTTVLASDSSSSGSWRLNVLGGAAGFALAAFTIIYGAYGDPNPKSGQKDVVPFLVGLAAAVTIALFAAVVPLASRVGSRSARWALGLSIAGVAALAAFWSGIPILLGVAAILVAKQARDQSGPARAAFVLGCIAVAATISVTILGNTIFS
jgi:hypothetical protein